ncbi:response regulator (plasmid) [Hymenobacter sp. BRD128]|uniref:ATP-binding protein n=1 Tax=Hymenobacter sp. BRD128 TaxID=2675878 RepID=UPI0015662B27|nr:ATP-binding protein [Hymenobacter sp. BRD128]QKG59202.1 response regulator [Hymenobacter sp. BRD128]
MAFLRLSWYALLLALLLISGSLRAQQSTYWDAPPDSLRQVLAQQRTDTARLRTLRHLADLTEDEQDLAQVVVLAARLHRPEYRPYRLWLEGQRRHLPGARLDSVVNATILDSLQTAVELFDRLGQPRAPLLNYLRLFFIDLQRPEARRAYYAHKLVYYQQHQDLANMAACYHALAGYYGATGDYNRSISYLLQAAELGQRFSRAVYYNELGSVAIQYLEWGNYAQAQHYFQLALQQPGASWRNFLYCHLTTLYLRKRQYGAALAAASRALYVAADPTDPFGPYDRTYALVLKAQVLLAQHQVPAAGRLLPLAQHLADSLHIRLVNTHSNFELAATWARYYTAVGDPARAEAAWQQAYRQACQSRSRPLQLTYLRQLAEFYDQQRRPASAAWAALAATRLADTLAAVQGRLNVAYFEQQQAERRQTRRLHRVQAQVKARAERQRALVGGLLAGVSGLAVLACGQWYRRRRQQQAHTILAHQHQLLIQQKEQIAEQAVQLEELDAIKNQFFANVSHELRTPLTLVLGPLDGLLTAPGPPLPAAVRESVALAHRHARRLQELVNRILDLTKLEAGGLVLRPAPTTLAPLLRQIIAQFDSLAIERRIALVAPTALPETLRLLLDADKVEQVLTNLLINALNHTPAGGAVLVTTALPGLDGLYAVTVRDTGPGIAAAEQARVFERFYQSPQQQAQGGTGLGLALSRELATLLGGSLTLVSETGQGAAFTLRFPALELSTEEVSINQTQTAPTEGAPPPKLTNFKHDARLSASGIRSRVLVAEDQSNLRTYLGTLLAADCDVHLAEDGQAALDLLARAGTVPFDLLVTDAMMPRLSGTELLARLRANPTWADLPVLMLTARADDEHHRAALAVGVDDYLTKPFVPTELRARVRALLTHHRIRRSFAALPAEAPPPAALPEDAAPAKLVLPTSTAAQLAQWQARVTPVLADPTFGPAELASLLCLSERTLYRRLGELVGLTPAAWLRELRLAHARHLLESGNFGSVVAVAEAAGFANAKSFGQRYAERFGRRPGDYRT